ncbi:MAG: hypothetical protein Q9186_002015 [Xanthomendoza sp. 1 TL-2023]
MAAPPPETRFLDVANGLDRTGPSGTSLCNWANMMAIREVINGLNDRGVTARDIVIISFYEGQVQLLREQIGISSDGIRGCSEICPVDAFLGRRSSIVIADFGQAVNQDNFYPATNTLCPKVDAFLNQPGRIHAVTATAIDGLFFVGQFALFAASRFPGGIQQNSIFRLAESLFHQGLVVLRDPFVDPEAFPGHSPAEGPITKAVGAQYDQRREHFIRLNLNRGNQQLGIPRTY